MAPLLLLIILAYALAAVGIIYALRSRKFALAKRIALVALLGAILYLGLLLAFSMRSEEKLLSLHEPKHFCGFYLDCHLAASVENVKTQKSIGQKNAQGTYWIVTVKVMSDAKQARLLFDNPTAVIHDDEGKEYARATDAEQALEQSKGRAVSFSQMVEPNGGSYTKELVFDLPASVRTPRLLITKGGSIERLTELFVIEDEDSLLHKKTRFRLEPQQSKL